MNRWRKSSHRLAGGGLLLGLLAGCVQIPDAAERNGQTLQLAAARGWQPLSLHTGSFSLRVYLPASVPATGTLTVYLEGDGLAWLSADTPSLDPTPLTPLSLLLALQDPEPAAYLARPCQYEGVGSELCAQKYWTSHRFAPEVVQASNQALDQLKQRFPVQRLVLVGYSGGGTLASLLAARRQDVAGLITLAANLDHQAWTAAKYLSPLTGSLNPADSWQRLQHVPQRHYVGVADRQVGSGPVLSYAARFPATKRPEVVLVPGFDHTCCWQQRWPALKQEALFSWHMLQ